MNARWTTWLAISLWTISILLAICVLVLLYANGRLADQLPGDAPISILVFCSLATVGVLLAIHRPGNPIGWIFLAAGLSQGIVGIAGEYAYYVAEFASSPPPELTALYWLSAWVWVFAYAVPPTFGILLFPTGRLPSPRWRPFAWLVAFFLAEGIIAGMFSPGALNMDEKLPEVANPIGVDGVERLSGIFSAIFSVDQVLGFILITGAVASVLARLRVAGEVERQQIKWFAMAMVILPPSILTEVMIIVLTDINPDTDGGIGIAFRAFRALVIATIPVAIGIAILRHNLYDIDRLINRSLVYGSLSVLLLLSFFDAVLFFQYLLDPFTGGNDLAVAGSTLLVAALIRPARNRLQRFVDRRFYRRKYDAQRTLRAFSVTARDAVHLDDLTDELTNVVVAAMQPAHVSIWLPGDPVENSRR